MRDLSQKSVPLLISKLTSAVVTSTRSRDNMDMWRRREELKDELTARGVSALEPLLDHLRRHDDPEVATHTADVIGRIGSSDAVIPLAKILAGDYLQHTKRSAAHALTMIRTPDATLAVNLWQTRVQAVRTRLADFTQNDNMPDPELGERLQALASQLGVSPLRVAESYLLLTTEEKLSPDAQMRLNTLRLSPAACNYLEALYTPR